MNIKYSEKQLEFEKVKELISQECHSSIGAEQALGVSPMHDKKKLVHHLGFIKEIQYLIRIGYNLDFRMLSDLTPLFKNHDEVVFSYLELKQIIDNMIIVESMLGIELEENIEYLSELISGFESCNDLIKRFKQVFDHEGDVLDSASEELRRIRKQKRSTRRNIVKTLDMRIKADSNDLSDSVFTLRDNRYVLPVKDVAAGGFKGVEHGSSSSRSTIFIEPLDIVADNNKLIRLNSDEKQEVFRILKNFSYDVILKKSIIISNCNLLRDLDLKFALGRYANRINGVVPELSDKPEIRLKGARHPLLINSLGSIKKVIPFDIELNDTMKILLISGPNTGGKTVTLKSIGLLTIMTHAGIPIPVDDSSVVGTFDSVFADIGDDQSIEASLSTFSSHIKRIAEMIEFGTEKSLILIDEIGAATDPEQGGALAQAVLERFLEKGMSGVITTHYTSLKLFAEEEKKCSNASMQFDPESLSPTYCFKFGLPGNSFAIEIASSYGFDKALIERAQEITGKQTVDLTTLIKKMNQEKKNLARESYQHTLKRRLLEQKINEYESKLNNIEKNKKRIEKEALKKGRDMISNIQSELNNEINSIRNQEKIDNRKKREMMQKSLNKASSIGSKFDKKLNSDSNKEGWIPLDKPEIGKRVWVDNFDSQGEITSIEKDKIVVSVNGFLFTTDRNSLLECVTEGKRTASTKVNVSYGKSPSRGKSLMEIKVLGKTFSEALPEIEEFIEDAKFHGLSKVRIVHGKGTGVLRSKIRQHLRRTKIVDDFFSPPPEAGGDGVTVVCFDNE